VREPSGRVPPSPASSGESELKPPQPLRTVSRTFLFVKFPGTPGFFLCNQLSFAGFIQ